MCPRFRLRRTWPRPFCAATNSKCRVGIQFRFTTRRKSGSRPKCGGSRRTCWLRGGTGSCDAMGDTRAAWYAIGGGGSSKMDAISEETNEASRRSKLQDGNDCVRGGKAVRVWVWVWAREHVRSGARHQASSKPITPACCPVGNSAQKSPFPPARVVVVVVRHRHVTEEVRPGWWLWWFWWFWWVVVVVVVVAAIRRYRGPAMRQAGEMRGGMSVCDALSGVHTMTNGCIKGENDDGDVAEGLRVATILGTNSWRSHPVCRQDRKPKGWYRGDHAAKRTTHQKDGTPLLFTWTHFTRFRVQTDALWQGGPLPCLKLALGSLRSLHPNQQGWHEWLRPPPHCDPRRLPAPFPHCFPKSRHGMKQPFELEQAFRP